MWRKGTRPKSAEIIQDVLEHVLIRPGETRWNSLYDSLKQISGIMEKSAALYKALSLKNHIWENEFDYTDEYLSCAEPIAEAIDASYRC